MDQYVELVNKSYVDNMVTIIKQSGINWHPNSKDLFIFVKNRSQDDYDTLEGLIELNKILREKQ